MSVAEEFAPPTITTAHDVSIDAENATPLFSAVVPDEFCSGGESLRSLYQQLASILAGPGADNEGALHPTTFALQRGIEVLEQVAYALMSEQFAMPPGAVTTDEFGGLRVEWWNGNDRVVILMIGASKQRPSYAYSRFGRDDGGLTEDRVLPVRLAERLKKLTGAQA